MSETRIWDVTATMLSVDEVSGGAYRAVLRAPQIAREALPFQFVEVRVRDGNDPLLRRPFSLSLIDPTAGNIGITWAVTGRGTSMMTEWKPGDSVAVMGPLGNGFLPEGNELILIAGGTGLAPMYPLAAFARRRGIQVSLLYGAKSKKLLWDTHEFRSLGIQCLLATEDGEEGARGFVTDLLQSGFLESKAGAAVLACGPKPMLKKVKDICRGKVVRLYISLEERMACGIGLCRGCAVKASGENKGYHHICIDGPVFLADAVDLEGEE